MLELIEDDDIFHSPKKPNKFDNMNMNKVNINDSQTESIASYNSKLKPV